MNKRVRNNKSSEFDSFLKTLSSISLTESFGTKIDTIVRHILYLKSSDPLVKVLVFSQWEQVLEIITKSMDIHKISWLRIEHSSRKKIKKGKEVIEFQNNPDITCFLLNSKSQSSGLTLIAASHIFIVEPILSGLDQQGIYISGHLLLAINRIHRIGQTKETFVWRYVICDTIEERLLGFLGSSSGISLSLIEEQRNSSNLKVFRDEKSDEEILMKVIGLSPLVNPDG